MTNRSDSAARAQGKLWCTHRNATDFPVRDGLCQVVLSFEQSCAAFCVCFPTPVWDACCVLCCFLRAVWVLWTNVLNCLHSARPSTSLLQTRTIGRELADCSCGTSHVSSCQSCSAQQPNSNVFIAMAISATPLVEAKGVREVRLLQRRTRFVLGPLPGLGYVPVEQSGIPFVLAYAGIGLHMLWLSVAREW